MTIAIAERQPMMMAMRLLMIGSHPDINTPSIPENWVPAMQKVEKREPDFDEIDNPGQ
jgi:hypothetical protein